MDANENKALIAQAFEKWGRGEANFFDLLAEDATWTITGSSPAAKTYTSRRQFIDEVLRNISDKLDGAVRPTVRQIVADGDWVVVLWDGQATRKDGGLYQNTYSWWLRLQDSRIVEAVAMLDTVWLDELLASGA
jgi:ketosteroid isomerase-like protein